ncbi:MAG: acetyl-CoA C-acetyltransferase [Acidobacteriota bacterium]
MSSAKNQKALRDDEVVIVDGVRTPMVEYEGHFADLSANDLGGLAISALIERSGAEAGQIDHVVMGNALQTSGDAIYGARHASLKGGLSIEVPALTVNRICGSGIQSIVSAAQLILLGESDTCIAGGQENMTQAPHVIRGARKGFRLGQGQLEDSLMVALMDPFCGFYMAQTAENLARDNDISREEQDAFALRSQQSAAAAIEAGKLAEEIVPVTVGKGKRERVIDADDHCRPETTLESLAKLRPAFGKDGMVTAGNASGIVDGAAAVLTCSGAVAKERGWEPLGRIAGWAVAGVEPRIMGIGPVPAIRKVLDATGCSLGEVDLIEINEAFAAQYLACERALELDRDRVNVNGGAIALGHPLAASGTRITLTLLKELRRRGGKRGIASACIGGGQGIAIMVETL